MEEDIDLVLQDFKPKNTEKAEHWNDWYFATNFNYKGREYLLKLVLIEGSFMGGSRIDLKLAAGPILLRDRGIMKVIENPEDRIFLSKPQDEGDLEQYGNEDEITIEMDDLKASFTVDEQRVASSNETINGKLTFHPRGPPLWWGDGRDGECKVAHGTNVSGFELFSDVCGTMHINSEKIPINSRGVFEHVWIRSFDILKKRLLDWAFLNFEDTYLFLCHCESVLANGCPSHFEYGVIYLKNENICLNVDKVEFIPENWAFLESASRFIPLSQKVSARTDKGILELNTTLSLCPLYIQPPTRLEELTMHNITGWNLLFYDAGIQAEGKFYYDNGEILELTDGRGVNEQIRVFPLY